MIQHLDLQKLAGAYEIARDLDVGFTRRWIIEQIAADTNMLLGPVNSAH